MPRIGSYQLISGESHIAAIEQKHEVLPGKFIDVVLLTIGKFGMPNERDEVIHPAHIYFISSKSMAKLYEILCNKLMSYEYDFYKVVFNLTEHADDDHEFLIPIKLASSLVSRGVIDSQIHTKVLDYLEMRYEASLLSRSDMLTMNHALLIANRLNYDLYAGMDFVKEIIEPRRMHVQLVFCGSVYSCKPRKRHRKEKDKGKVKRSRT